MFKKKKKDGAEAFTSLFGELANSAEIDFDEYDSKVNAKKSAAAIKKVKKQKK